MVRVVPLRLDNEIVGFVDMLIDLGVYSSRSKALRDLIKIGIEAPVKTRHSINYKDLHK